MSEAGKLDLTQMLNAMKGKAKVVWRPIPSPLEDLF